MSCSRLTSFSPCSAIANVTKTTFTHAAESFASRSSRPSSYAHWCMLQPSTTLPPLLVEASSSQQPTLQPRKIGASSNPLPPFSPLSVAGSPWAGRLPTSQHGSLVQAATNYTLSIPVSGSKPWQTANPPTQDHWCQCKQQPVTLYHPSPPVSSSKPANPPTQDQVCKQQHTTALHVVVHDFHPGQWQKAAADSQPSNPGSPVQAATLYHPFHPGE